MTDKPGIVLKTEYDAEAAFLASHTGEQERRFFHALCYVCYGKRMIIEYKAQEKNKETAGMTVFLCMCEISKSNQTVWDGFPFPLFADKHGNWVQCTW